MPEIFQPFYLATFSFLFFISLIIHFLFRIILKRLKIVDVPDGEKKKHKMSLQKTEASAGTAHILFEESQLQLMFYVFEVAIVVPLFSFFSSKFFFICTIYYTLCSSFGLALSLFCTHYNPLFL